MDNVERQAFSNLNDAEAAVHELQSLGYGANEISVVMSEETRDRYAQESGDGRGVAGAIGGVIGGGGIGALIAAAAVAVPLTGGAAALPIGALILASAGAGAAAGGIVGSLADAGIARDGDAEPQQNVNGSGVLVAVRAKNEDREHVRAILRGERSRSAATGS